METFINKNYTVGIEIISPVHIGAGSERNWVRGIDFIHDRNKGRVYRLNLKNLYEKIPTEKLSLNFLQPNEGNLKKLIRSHGVKLEDVSSEIFESFLQPSQEIKTHIKDGKTGKPYIPGSSIKGALRSVLFNHFRMNNEQTNEDVFGSIKDGTDFMRFIRLGDAYFNETMLMHTKIFNLYNDNSKWTGGWKHSFNNNGTNGQFNERGFVTTYEALGNFEKSSFRIGFAEGLFSSKKSFGGRQKDQLIFNGIVELFAIINNHTGQYLEKERTFFKQYQTDLSDKILDNIDYLLGLLVRFPQCCLLKLGAGSGFHSITGDWRFNDHLNTVLNPDWENLRYNSASKSKEPTRYKSRKFVFEYAEESNEPELIPMGFVMLSLI